LRRPRGSHPYMASPSHYITQGQWRRRRCSNMMTLPSTTRMQTQLRCVPLKWEGMWS
jgi:hypothetical protein